MSNCTPRPPDDSEVARNLAEAEYFKAQARREAALAETAELERDDLRRATENILASDSYHHVYHFNQAVTSSSVSSCLYQLSKWDRQDPEAAWTIVINSPGGSVIDGFALGDAITSYSLRGGGTHEITMVVRGYAASMGGILLQFADKRVIGPESYLMIHEVATMTMGKIGEIKDEVKFLDTISERVVNLFVSRAQGKITKAQFKKNWLRQDWWLPSDQALKYGFCDEIG